MTSLQNQQATLKHLITLENLSKETLMNILHLTRSMFDEDTQQIKTTSLLAGTRVINIFFEASTRTRTSFEIATKQLGGDFLQVNIATSATSKGESLLDTLYTLQGMQADIFVLRHSLSGAAHFIASHVAPHVSVINGGDGCHAHPTQALLDMYTIQQHKKNFSDLSVAIVGDVKHSRVARSQLLALNILGVPDIRVIGPKPLIPTHINTMGAKVYHDIEVGLRDVDVIMVLRLQKERFASPLLPSAQEYYRCYGLTSKRVTLAKPDAVVMHPGPMNRGIEIASEIADGPQSVILEQVNNGIAVRMAVMAMLRGHDSLGGAP